MNSLKTIYSRLTTMDSAIGALDSVGVSVKESNGQMKSATTIIDELAGKWDGLSAAKQQNIAVDIAGRYQLSRFLALMGGYDLAISATEAALNSQGSAMRENAKYMESLEARIERMKTQWQELALTMGDAVLTNTLINLISVATELGNSLVTVIDKFGLFPPLLGTVAMAYVLFSAKARASILSVIGIITAKTSVLHSVTVATTIWGTSMGMSGVAVRALTVATVGLTMAVRGLMIVTGVGLAVAALGFIVEKLVNKFGNANKVIDETSMSIDKLNESASNLNGLKKLASEYEKFKDITDLTLEDKTKLATIENELASSYGITTTSLLENKDAYEVNNALIEESIKLKEKELALKYENEILSYKSDKSNIDQQIIDSKNRLKAFEDEKKALLELEKQGENLKRQDLNLTGDEMLKYQKKDRKMGLLVDVSWNPLEILAAKIKEANSKIDTELVKLDENLSKKSSSISAKLKTSATMLKNNGVEIKDASSILIDGFSAIAAINDIDFDNSTVLEKIVKELNSLDITSIEDVEAAFNKFGNAAGNNTDALEILKNAYLRYQVAIKSGSYDSGEDPADQFEQDAKAAKDAAKEYDNLVSDLKKLNQTLYDTRDGKSLTAEATQELIANFPELLDGIYKTTAGWGIEEIALNDLREAIIEKATQGSISEKNATAAALNEITKRTKMYGVEIEAINDVQSARDALVKFDEKISFYESQEPNTYGQKLMWEALANQVRTQKEALEGLVNDGALEDTTYKAFQSHLDKLNDIFNDKTFGVTESTKNSTKAKEKDNKETKETIRLLTEWQKKLLDVDNSLHKVYSDRTRFAKWSKEYQDSLKEEIRLLNEKKDIYKEATKDPTKLMEIEQTITKTTSTKTGTPSTNTNTNTNNTASTPALTALFDKAKELYGSFKYEQNGGKFVGTFEEFLKKAESDCSQLVQEFFKEFLNIDVPRVAADQFKQGMKVAKEELAPGDLVFFNTTGKTASHVGIYKGKDKFVHMGSTSKLSEQSLKDSYWASKYDGARRIDGVNSAAPYKATSSSTATTSSSKTETAQPTQDQLEAGAREAEQNYRDMMDLIYQRQINLIDSLVETSNRELKKIDTSISKDSYKKTLVKDTSEEWRKLNLNEYDYYTQKQKELSNQNNTIRKHIAEFGITSGEFDDLLEQNSQEWLKYQEKKNQNLISSLESIRNEISNKYSSQRATTDRRISLIGDVNTEEDAKAIAKYGAATVKSLKNEHKDIYAQIVKQRKILNDPKSSGSEKNAARFILDELELDANNKNVEMINAARNYGKQQAEAFVFGFNDTIEELNFQMSLLGDSEEDKKRAKELTEELLQVAMDSYKALQLQLIELQRKLGTELSNDERAEKQAKYDAMKEDAKKFQLQITKINNDAFNDREREADNIISNYKRMLEQEKKLRQDFLKEAKKDEDERHKAKIKNLDEELNKFQEQINAQLKSLDSDISKEDYEEGRNKLLKEREEIQKKIDILSLDDSFEAKAKKKDLQTQLDQKDEDIIKYQRDRERVLRKEGLQKQLEDRTKSIENEKKLENDFYESNIKNIDKELEMLDKYYEQRLTDEKFFYDMKKNLMSEDTQVVINELKKIEMEYAKFFAEIERNSKIYGDKIASNLTYSFGKDLDNAKNFKNGEIGNGSGGNAENSPKPSVADTIAAWNKYLENKKQAEELAKTIKNTTSKELIDLSRSKIAELNTANNEYRSKHKFKDGGYNELVNLPYNQIFSAESGGMTPAWGKEGKLLMAHEKELILNKTDTSKLRDAIQITRDIFNGLKNFDFSNILARPRSGDSSTGTVINKLEINVSGNFAQRNGNDVGVNIIDEMKRMGVKFS
ncbi:phage tail tape measure protein [Paenibacillaceae bacterium]|nr:phage tail tape measure protein [Paenibacillaceae bacterium]